MTPLILLAGTLCDARLFAPLVAALDQARDVRALALPAGRSVGAMARKLLGDMPHRFALLGFSLGGIVAVEAALDAPDRIAALALVNSTARPVPFAEHAGRRSAARQDVAAHVRRDLLPAYASQAGEGAILAMANDRASLYPDQTEAAITRPDRRADLAGLAMPTLVVGGERDAINPPQAQAELAAAIPDARLALIPDAGHFTPLDAPTALAILIEAWLVQADAKQSSKEKA